MTTSIKFSIEENLNLPRGEYIFSCFLKVSVFVSSWRLAGSEFHAFDPAYEKPRSPNLSFSFGVSYRKLLAERSLSRPGRSALAVIMSAKWAGLRPTRTRCISTHSLYCMRSLIGSQCKLLRTYISLNHPDLNSVHADFWLSGYKYTKIMLYTRETAVSLNTSKKALKMLTIITINTFIDCYTRKIR